MTDKGWPGEPGMPLPTWETCKEKRIEQASLTALERFIYEHEPAGEDEDEFRLNLAAALAAAREEGRREGIEQMRRTAALSAANHCDEMKARGRYSEASALSYISCRIRALPTPPQPQEPPHE